MRKNIKATEKVASFTKDTPTIPFEDIKSGDYIYYKYSYILDRNGDGEFWENTYDTLFQIQIDPTLNLPTGYTNHTRWDDRIKITTVSTKEDIKAIITNQSKDPTHTDWELKFFKGKDIKVTSKEYTQSSYYICDKCGYEVELLQERTDITNWPEFYEKEQTIWQTEDGRHLCHKCLDRGIGERPMVFTIKVPTEQRQHQIYNILINNKWKAQKVGKDIVNILNVDYTKVSYTQAMLNQLSKAINVKIKLDREYNIDKKADYSKVFLYKLKETKC